mgnify:CR=1 FL=1
MTTQQILRVRATVQADGQIAIDLPVLLAGAAVEVLLLLPELEQDNGSPQQPLRNRLPAGRPIQTAADVELFLEAERAAWEH